jgi:mRNA interferase MazF
VIAAPTLQWSVFTIDLDSMPPGSRGGGIRPVLVVSRESANQALPVVTVLPITTRRTDRRVYPNEVLLRSGTAGLKSDAIAMAHQTRTVAKRRLTDQLGAIEDDDLRSAIRRAMCVQLNLDAT